MEPKTRGELKSAIRIDRRVDISDSAGGTKGDWDVLIARRSCRLLPRSGGYELQAQRDQGVIDYDCWLPNDRQTRGIKAGDRAVDLADQTRTFKITPVGDMTGRGQYLLLQLGQGRADG
jgi:hypothetical protein